MMTLDEAILHCEEKAKELREQAGFDTDNERYRMSESEKADCLKCASEHEQLAEWLKELKKRREQDDKRAGETDSSGESTRQTEINWEEETPAGYRCHP